MYQPDDEKVLFDLETLKVYFDPLRARIMQLLQQPRTIHQVAELLEVPFTRLYYQFNLLEKHGLIRVVETRLLSGAAEEKMYQVSARIFTVDRALLTVGGTEGETFIDVILRTVLDATKEDVRKSIQAGVINMNKKSPEPDALFIQRGFFNLTAERTRWFHEQLRALVGQLYAAQDGDEGEKNSYALSFAIYPSVFPSTGEPNPDDNPSGTEQ